ncbi:hypothetical protein SKAU_G00320750 [Synaphobranchus kaupii]|uniref:Uncharacterized protein n=1 Tax=Synaphobranchus kaupii TaxID=118154 RepID=A0A9Q1ENN7_SYNKA|nr:hypothetical protein SKAU_G00320750 [Synaphobranchus kaupii]
MPSPQHPTHSTYPGFTPTPGPAVGFGGHLWASPPPPAPTAFPLGSRHSFRGDRNGYRYARRRRRPPPAPSCFVADALPSLMIPLTASPCEIFPGPLLRRPAPPPARSSAGALHSAINQRANNLQFAKNTVAV